MKANELMVGDYIYVKRGYDCHLTLESIKGILQDEKEVYPIKITTGETISLEDIIPIPLTAEILEKNGFVEWREKCYRWEYAEGIYINADFTEEEPWAHISNRCYSATPVCRYVHELQHALRLCGIEKIIEL